MIFSNVSARSSFRLAFAMVLLGLLSPPGTGDDKQMLEEDVEYAACEGTKRLRVLCQQARGCIANAKLGLSAESASLVLELVDGVEWLAGLTVSAVISSTSKITNLACLGSSLSKMTDLNNSQSLAMTATAPRQPV